MAVGKHKLRKRKYFESLKKTAFSEWKKLRNQKKRWASYPVQLGTGQNAQNY